MKKFTISRILQVLSLGLGAFAIIIGLVQLLQNQGNVYLSLSPACGPNILSACTPTMDTYLGRPLTVLILSILVFGITTAMKYLYLKIKPTGRKGVVLMVIACIAILQSLFVGIISSINGILSWVGGQQMYMTFEWLFYCGGSPINGVHPASISACNVDPLFMNISLLLGLLGVVGLILLIQTAHKRKK